MSESNTEKTLSFIERFAPIVGIGILGYLGYKILAPILNFGSQTADNIRNIMKAGPAYETAKPIDTSAYGFTNDDFLTWMDQPIYTKSGASAIRKAANSAAAVVSYPAKGDKIGNFYSVSLEMLPQPDGTKKAKIWVMVSNGAGGSTIGYIPLNDLQLHQQFYGIYLN